MQMSKKLLIDVGQKLSEIWNSDLTNAEKMKLENFLKTEIAKGFEIREEPFPKFLEKYRLKESEAKSLLEQ